MGGRGREKGGEGEFLGLKEGSPGGPLDPPLTYCTFQAKSLNYTCIGSKANE